MPGPRFLVYSLTYALGCVMDWEVEKMERRGIGPAQPGVNPDVAPMKRPFTNLPGLLR